MNVLLYGAGKCCDSYLSYYNAENERIVGIVDKDPNKSGKIKKNIKIFSIEKMEDILFDKLIIVVDDCENILDYFLEKGIDKEKIFVYCRKNNKIISFESFFDKYINRKMYLNQSIVQIKTGLLSETLQENEFSGYNRVMVRGNYEDYIIIRKFFEHMDKSTNVEHCLKICELSLNDKIILCGEDYKIDFKNIKNKILNSNQCIIIPLFDVENTIVLKPIYVCLS